jgi:hypothetical protein
MEAAFLELLVSGGLLLSAAFLGRVVVVERQERHRQTYTLRFPREVAPEQVTNFLLALAGRPSGRDSLVFETVAEQGRLTHRLRVPLRSVEFVQAQLRTALPGVRFAAVEHDAPLPTVSRAWSLLLTRHRLPLNSNTAEALNAALLASLDPLAKGERLVVQWILTPKRARAPKRALSPRERNGYQQTADLLTGTERLNPQQYRHALLKQSGPLFAASLRLGAEAETKHRAKQLLARPYAALRGLRVPGVDLWPLPAPRRLVTRRLNAARVPLLTWPLTLNGDELTGVIGVPLGSVVVPGLAAASSIQLPPSPFLPWRGLPLGTATYAHHERPVAISLQDATRHVHMLGGTGSGKSTALTAIFHALAEQGFGCLVIDPKGDLITALLDAVPANRERDVIWLDPTDSQPPGVNLLDCPNETDRELVVDGVVTAFRNRFESSWGPRLEDCLRMACQTLVAMPGRSLVDVDRLLTDHVARQAAIAHTTDETVRRYWRWYDGLKPHLQSEVAAPVLNKIRGTILRPSIARLVGKPSTFHFDDVLAEGKLLLVSVPHGLLGPDTAALVGALVYQQAWAAIQRRVRLPQAERKPFALLLDEFQQFVAGDDSFGESLALARGYGVPIVCAHQHLTQLTPELRATVLANARTKLCFALGARDAATMAKEFGPPVTATDLQQLDRFEALVSAHVGSQQLPPVNVATPPPVAPTGRAEAIRQMSRDRYGAPVASAEPSDEQPPAAIGRRSL